MHDREFPLVVAAAAAQEGAAVLRLESRQAFVQKLLAQETARRCTDTYDDETTDDDEVRGHIIGHARINM